MKKNPEIAFATAWFDISDHSNRKGIQGLGTCVVVSDVKKIAEGIALMNKSFPDLKKTITLEWVLTNIWKSKMWMIMPSYIKHWDDAMYGEDQFKEFTL